jgi:hypothetical protein
MNTATTRRAGHLCANAGRNIDYEFRGDVSASFSMTCTLPSGAHFSCLPTGGPFGNIEDCH